MTKTLWFLFIATVLIGFAVASYFVDQNGFVVAATKIKDAVTAKIQPITSWWSNLPDIAKTVIMAGIPTLFTLFFAWTKSRAMQQLQQTQTDAKTQYTQLTTEIGQAQQQVADLNTQKINLEEQVKAYADGNSAIKNLTTNLEEATTLVSQKQQQIDDLTQTIRDLENKIEGMKTQIDYVKRQP